MKLRTRLSFFFFAVCFIFSAYSGLSLTGDVNNSGDIDIIDALLVAQYCVGLPAEINTNAADANCDGTIDIIDALNIAKYFVGLLDSLCSGTGGFVHARGEGLVAGESETPLYLRGVCFGNEVWTHDTIYTLDHSELDFQRVKDMGMNTIRFYLHYRYFEDDDNPYVYKQSGWDWLDQNVNWAKNYGLYLILNIHIPQGGFQSEGGGTDLWDIPENRDRLTALWKAIAERYAQEPAVGGYDLVNEPVVSTGVEQWKSLAQRLVDEIRTVDRNHLIIVEQLCGVKNNPSLTADPEYSWFLVNDPDQNVMYDFHFYEPMEYTYQNAPWTPFGEAGTYPDETRVVPPGDITYAEGIYNNPAVPAGTSDWAYYEGVKFKVMDTSFILAKPVTIAQRVDSGTVYFDNFTIKEYDESGQLVDTIWSHDIEPSSGVGLWSENESGRSGIGSSVYHTGTSALYVTGTTANAVCYFNSLYFEPEQDYSYSISGWARGVDLPSGASCSFSIEFDTSPSGQPVYHRNKAYLESIFKSRMQFGLENKVPVNLGEFGLYRDCFTDGRNGIQWVNDVLDIIGHYQLNFTYHCYHQYPMGIYYNDGSLPDPRQCNQELVTLFKNTLPDLP
ncbi:MAG: cellulase family glycosylhydrolase [Spirochaetales bacterium]|nr:cellulase family glycosylhydrolase [Spirochaetales bacterium]